MQALVLEDWWRLVVAERTDPVVNDGDVLIEVAATGICGSDLHGYTGENGRREAGQIMGHETVGRVVALGTGVGQGDAGLGAGSASGLGAGLDGGPGHTSSTDWAAAPDGGLAVGNVVTVNPVIGCGHCDRCAAGMTQACADKTVIGVTPGRPAAFAQLLVAPAGNVVSLPADVPVEYGALVEPLAVGLHAIRRAPVRNGHRVLVIGGGPIGQACVLAAFRDGAAAVTVTEIDADRRALNVRLGASVLDPAGSDLPHGDLSDGGLPHGGLPHGDLSDGSPPAGGVPASDLPAGSLRAAVEEQLIGPPDVVIDAVGSSPTLRDALTCAPIGAPVVLVGMASPELAIAAYNVSTHERSIIGSFCYTPAEFRETAEWVGGAPRELAQLIDGRVGLADAPDAFERLATGRWRASKVLVLPNESSG